MSNEYLEGAACPLSAIQNVLAGKWKLTILWIVGQQTRRFGELNRLLPGISRGVLTQQLRELENDKLVMRNVYREVPPKVEYSLTEMGKSFIPVLSKMIEWGAVYVNDTTGCDVSMCVNNRFPCNACYDNAKNKEALQNSND